MVGQVLAMRRDWTAWRLTVFLPYPNQTDQSAEAVLSVVQRHALCGPPTGAGATLVNTRRFGRVGQ